MAWLSDDKELDKLKSALKSRGELPLLPSWASLNPVTDAIIATQADDSLRLKKDLDLLQRRVEEAAYKVSQLGLQFTSSHSVRSFSRKRTGLPMPKHSSRSGPRRVDPFPAVSRLSRSGQEARSFGVVKANLESSLVIASEKLKKEEKEVKQLRNGQQAFLGLRRSPLTVPPQSSTAPATSPTMLVPPSTRSLPNVPRCRPACAPSKSSCAKPVLRHRPRRPRPTVACSTSKSSSTSSSSRMYPCGPSARAPPSRRPPASLHGSLARHLSAATAPRP